MTSDDLADLLVTHLNGLADKPITYQAVKPEEVAEADKERSDWGVFIVPYSEAEEAFDRGDTCREELVCSVVINGPVRGSVTREKGCELSRFLRFSLRETELGGYRWQENETVSLYDSDALKTKGQFLSLFRATYYDFA